MIIHFPPSRLAYQAGKAWMDQLSSRTPTGRGYTTAVRRSGIGWPRGAEPPTLRIKRNWKSWTNSRNCRCWTKWRKWNYLQLYWPRWFRMFSKLVHRARQFLSVLCRIHWLRHIRHLNQCLWVGMLSIYACRWVLSQKVEHLALRPQQQLYRWL